MKRFKRSNSTFYTGYVADEIVKFMEESGGIITHEDLLKYEAIERAPVTGTYDDYTIYSMPPPSSGGVHVVQMLNGCLIRLRLGLNKA